MSSLQALRSQKRIRILDLDPKRADSLKHVVEKKLRFLPHLDLSTAKGLEDPTILPCDLVVVFCWNLEEDEFLKWLSSFESRWLRQNSVWVPALIVSRAELNVFSELLERAMQSNWHFDVIHPDHLSSLPIRIANLLRIHDHLHELLRYEKELKSLQEQVNTLEQGLESIRLKQGF